MYRKNPAKALALVGALILPSALFTPLQFSMHSTTWFVDPRASRRRCSPRRAFAMVAPGAAGGRARTGCAGMGTAMATMYIFFIGGFVRRHPRRLLHRTRSACAARSSSSACRRASSAALLLMNGARFIRNDLSLVVEELLEEQEEHRKRVERRRGDARCCRSRTSTSPTARCRCCSTSTSRSHRGECVALLGTNGAGKSTILRVISGLEVPERGVVRLNGRNITYVAPEQRVQARHRAAPGGKGVFPSLTVDAEPRGERAARRAAPTPRSTPRIDDGARAVPRARGAPQAARAAACRAASSRCSRSRRVLIHEPEVLLIDELSLGLAPVVVQRCSSSSTSSRHAARRCSSSSSR